MTLLIPIVGTVLIALFILWVIFEGDDRSLDDFADDPEPVPDTPIVPPPDDMPAAPYWNALELQKHVEAMNPRDFRKFYQCDWQPPEPDWQDDLRAYHSHLCPCPACAEAEARRQSRIQSMLRKNSQW